MPFRSGLFQRVVVATALAGLLPAAPPFGEAAPSVVDAHGGALVRGLVETPHLTLEFARAARAAAGAGFDVVPAFVHAEEPFEPGEVDAAARMGVRLDAASWVGPTRHHPTGFYAAIVPADPARVERFAEAFRVAFVNAPAKIERELDVARAASGRTALDGRTADFGAPLEGRGVKVGVIEAGVDVSHGSLSSASIVQHSYLGGPTDCGAPGALDDPDGHGTMVAGMIVSTHSRYAGFSRDVELHVLGNEGSTACNLAVGGVTSGVRQVKDAWSSLDLDVLSLSFGEIGGLAEYRLGISELAQAVTEAGDHGLLVVKSAGNTGDDSTHAIGTTVDPWPTPTDSHGAGETTASCASCVRASVESSSGRAEFYLIHETDETSRAPDYRLQVFEDANDDGAFAASECVVNCPTTVLIGPLLLTTASGYELQENPEVVRDADGRHYTRDVVTRSPAFCLADVCNHPLLLRVFGTGSNATSGAFHLYQVAREASRPTARLSAAEGATTVVSAEGTITSPADAFGVLVAGATQRRGSLEEYAPWSSRGPTLDGRTAPHFWLHAADIATTTSSLAWACPEYVEAGTVIETQPSVSCPGGEEVRLSDGVVRVDGTSFAAPQLAAVVALLKQIERARASVAIRDVADVTALLGPYAIQPVGATASPSVGFGMLRLDNPALIEQVLGVAPTLGVSVDDSVPLWTQLQLTGEDPDAEPLLLRVTWADDGEEIAVPVAPGEPTGFSHVWDSPGPRTLVTTVEDPTGLSDTITIEVPVLPARDFADFAWEAIYGGPDAYEMSARTVASPDSARAYTALIRMDARTGDYDIEVVASDAQTGDEVWTTRWGYTMEDQPYAIAVSPDGTKLAVVGVTRGAFQDWIVLCLDAQTGAILWTQTFNGGLSNNDEPHAVAFSPTGDRIFVAGETWNTASLDALLRAYDTDTGTLAWSSMYDLGGNEAWTKLVVSPDGGRVLVAGGSTTMLAASYDASTGAAAWTASDPHATSGRYATRRLSITPDGSTIVVAGQRTTGSAAFALDAATGAPRWSTDLAAAGVATLAAAAISPDGLRLYLGATRFAPAPDYDADAQLVALSVGDGLVLWTTELTGVNDTTASDVGVSPDGSAVYLAGAEEGALSIATFDADSGSTLRRVARSGDDGIGGSGVELIPLPDSSLVLLVGTRWTSEADVYLLGHTPTPAHP